MKLVIDANIVLAGLISAEGITRELLFSPNLELVSPDFLLEEIDKYRSVVKEKAGFSDTELHTAFSIVLSRIKIVPSTEYGSLRPIAKKISPDPGDTEYFALALKMSCPLWSNDKRLKGQKKVTVLSTSEMLKLL